MTMAQSMHAAHSADLLLAQAQVAGWAAWLPAGDLVYSSCWHNTSAAATVYAPQLLTAASPDSRILK
jgi:hypothetical protein